MYYTNVNVLVSFHQVEDVGFEAQDCFIPEDVAMADMRVCGQML